MNNRYPIVLRRALIALFAAAMASAQGTSSKTGPEVGQPIPAFKAVDQNGDARTFDDLKGPNGLLLLFHRSADW